MQIVSGYRGIWFELSQKSGWGDKYSGGLGTYTANHNPMAVYSPAANKTFFTFCRLDLAARCVVGRPRV